MEKVICAAIHLQTGVSHPGQPKNINKGLVVSGHNHANCLVNIGIYHLSKYLHTRIEGFLTTENRFIDRFDAYTIALNSKQIESSDEYTNRLTSQMLYTNI